MHGRPKTNSILHSISKHFITSFFFGMSMCILTMNDLYSLNTDFKGLNMDIQQVLILCNNFKPFVSNVLARFTNSKNLLGTMQEKKYKDYNILLMCITKDNLFKTNIVRFIWCATQCTLSMYKSSCSYICVIMQIWMLWSTKSSSHPKQIHLEDMLLERPLKVAMASTIIIFDVV